MDCGAPDQGASAAHVKTSTVSIVIPTRNAGPRIGELLAALRAQEIAVSPEIVVIDSGSRDKTPELAAECGARVIAVPGGSFHHGRTRNEAIRSTSGQFVVMTVQDALPADQTWLPQLLEPLLESPSVAGSYGLQAAPSYAGLLARARSAAWGEAFQHPVVRSLASSDDFWRMQPEERLDLIRFDNVTSCMRRSIWQEIPFPEQGYGEDMAWARSALLAGYQVAYVPSAQVWHSHERGWLYELRRAYVDGMARVNLVGWPSPSLTVGEAWSMLRRLLFFLQTHRFDGVTEPQEARRILVEELHAYLPKAQSRDKPAQAYETALRFCWHLTNLAAPLCPGGPFPEEAWSGLLRFALVSVVGQHLGTNAHGALQSAAFERLPWSMLHSFLHRGV